MTPRHNARELPSVLAGGPTPADLIDVARRQPESASRFPDGGQYRIEIPSVEDPDTFSAVVEHAQSLGVPVHRVSQGSGITLLSDSQIRDFALLGHDHAVEVCLFAGPRAPWDGKSASALTPDGRNAGWRHVGTDSLKAALDDVRRAVDLGIRSVLIADEGLAILIARAKQAGALPADLVVKASALLGIANPIGALMLEACGVDSLNVFADTPVGELCAYRHATNCYLDLYIEAPDGLGGFLRYHDIGAIVRAAAPVYLKFGLRNAAPIYPAGQHLAQLVRSSACERVRRAHIGLEHLGRQYPEAVMSASRTPDAGIPVAGLAATRSTCSRAAPPR
jgi:phosphoribosylcarboxyaminoimidazole (NCAIR) mutase